jgi:signal transduction histidine kinase/sugar lactone lactonase YvrE
MHNGAMQAAPGEGITVLLDRQHSHATLRLIAALCLWVWCACAATPPIRFYTIADGLAGNTVHSIWQDSRQFMWFATEEGLSRFDGHRFTNYGLEIGLPRAYVHDIIETRNGDYLVGTTDGLCRLPSGHPKCEVIRPDDKEAQPITILLEDREGSIWAGTAHGLYRIESAGARWVFRHVNLAPQPGSISAIVQDRGGALWVVADSGLYRRTRESSFEHYDERNGLPPHHVLTIAEDASGQMWAGAAGGGLYRLVRDPAPGRGIVARVYTVKDGLRSSWVQGLLRTSDGSLLVASGSELSDWTGISRQSGPPAPVLEAREVISGLFQDREGGVWVSVVGHGVGRTTSSGITTFTEADGLRGGRIDAIFESRAGELCALTKIEERGHTIKALGHFQSDRFRMVLPAFPKNTLYYGWGWGQIGFQDRAGEWWFAGGEGLYRFPAVSRVEDLSHTQPKAVYRGRDGIGSDDIFRIFEDTRGDVWIGAGQRVIQWERATGSFHPRLLPTGMLSTEGPGAFADDGRGGIWIGYYFTSGLGRWRDGRLALLDPAAGAPASRPNQIFRDRKGRIWIATSREGVARVDDPGAEHPRFQWIGTAQGLGSNRALCIAEDRWNRIYVGHGRGVDRLDPDTGRIRPFTNADGLAPGELSTCYGASDGTVWFATSAGVSRLIPEPDRQKPAPPAYVTGLYLRGVAQALGFNEAGSRHLDLASDQNQVQIDFAAISFSEPLRYQYKLEGTRGDWSAPANTRTVNFASLAPGRYRFLVRSVNAQGLPGEPASVSLNIAPPLWRRWWAETGAALLLALAAYGAHRYRLRHALAVERVRTRIASDLHDDIGANLSQIAILSEIARRGGSAAADGPLAKIAQVSRDTLRSMSDIIWAVDPERDRLSDLVHRMRHLAGDLLGSAGLDLRFHAAVPEAELASDARRQIFLIYKEALHNAARHSGAAQVEVAVEVAHGALVIRVADSGRGFDSSREHEGRGLANMQARAQEVNGALEVRSGVQGTSVVLRVPLTGRAGSRHLHVHAATPD